MKAPLGRLVQVFQIARNGYRAKRCGLGKGNCTADVGVAFEHSNNLRQAVRVYRENPPPQLTFVTTGAGTGAPGLNSSHRIDTPATTLITVTSVLLEDFDFVIYESIVALQACGWSWKERCTLSMRHLCTWSCELTNSIPKRTANTSSPPQQTSDPRSVRAYIGSSLVHFAERPSENCVTKYSY
jgi:hypothetical protein